MGKKSFNEWINNEIENIVPSGLLDTLDRERPYDGQLWTDTGERGRTEIRGITFRDLRDCFIRACFNSSSLDPKDYPKSVYDLDWENIDIIAVEQNMSCWVEKYMGIFPNVPELTVKETLEQSPLLEIPEDVENPFDEEVSNG